jgi:hypothetical protein
MESNLVHPLAAGASVEAGHDAVAPSLDFTAPDRTRRTAKTLLLVGGVLVAIGVAIVPSSLWMHLLLVSYYLIGLGLAGVAFVAIQYAVGGGWATVLRRVPEAMAYALPAGAIGLLIVLVANPSLYPWLHETVGHVDAQNWFKHFWLSYPFLLTRAAVFIGLWLLFSWLIIGHSRKQDLDGDLAHTHRNIRTSVIFLFVFAFSFCLASIDWIQSLEPEWYSTMWGLYSFSGLFVSGLAAIILLVIWLERSGPLRGLVTEAHMHDLGKLLFAFSTFWMYIWFSQYMLIWYSNISEETAYFIPRIHGAWGVLFVANVLLNWVVPFFLLLPIATKKNTWSLARIAVVVLVGRWVDLYLQIGPTQPDATPMFGLVEAGMVLVGFGLFALSVMKGLAAAPIVPARDPYYRESLHHH